MQDESLMTIGKHKGKPLQDVPHSYWTWFIEQEWAEHWAKLLAYAEKRVGKKFAPDRKPRKCTLTVFSTWVGNPDAEKYNDGQCPFDA
jgi:sugar phosphate isomerase/epimerase